MIGLVLCLQLALSAFATPRVKVGKTTLIGRDVPLLKQEFFGGIPYAEPPVANLRFKPPVLKKSLDTKTFDATNFGRSCLQYGSDWPVEDMSEDCLTINVYRPAGTTSSSKLPVLFWTYGGGNILGSAAEYNGSAIVARSIARGTPIIYVNYNYRAGPVGFPQGAEAEQNGVLNLTVKDIITALEWVQKFIHNFGGDPSKVTVSASSAGGVATSILFLNDHITRLARGGIFVSGYASSQAASPAVRGEELWQSFVAAVPACASTAGTGKSLECLRTVNTSAIHAAFVSSLSNSRDWRAFVPVIDSGSKDGVYPERSSSVLRKGTFAKLPFLAGTVLDEAAAFMSPQVNYTTEVIRAGLLERLVHPLGYPNPGAEEAVDKILELYPDIPALGSPFGTGNETFGLSTGTKRIAAIFGDYGLQSPRRAWSEAAAKAGVKSWGYLFAQRPTTTPPRYGVPHGSMNDLIYGNIGALPEEVQRLTTTIIDYWVSFTVTLDPNDGKGVEKPKWEVYGRQNPALLQLKVDDTKLIPDNFRKAQIDYMNSVPDALLY